MAKPFSKNKLNQIKGATSANKLLALKERNQKPFEAIQDKAAQSEVLKPYTTGNATRDLVGIEKQLNHLPEHLNTLDQRQLSESWDHADKIGKAAAWIKGHIILVMDRKYKAEAVRKFADERQLHKTTIYNYMHLAQLFPKVDPVLDPSFHFKAIAITHADPEKTVALIEEARSRKKEDPKYSVRDFVVDAEKKYKRKKSGDQPRRGSGTVIQSIASLLDQIKTAPDLHSHKVELQKLIGTIGELLNSI